LIIITSYYPIDDDDDDDHDDDDDDEKPIPNHPLSTSPEPHGDGWSGLYCLRGMSECPGRVRPQSMPGCTSC